MMTRTQLVVLIIALVAGFLAAGASRAQPLDTPTLTDLQDELAKCPVEEPCPLPPPKDVCGIQKGWRINLEPKGNATLAVVAGPCGEFQTPQNTISPCIFVSIKAPAFDLIEGASHPDCQPVPEPGLGLGLAFGGLGLSLIGRTSRSGQRHRPK